MKVLEIKWRWFQCILSRTAGWFRLGRKGWGLHYTCNPPLFSERNGYWTPFLVLGKWRFKKLPGRKTP